MLNQNPDEVECVLADGELTGHAHRARGKALSFANSLFCAPEGAVVTHEEHRRSLIPAGRFTVRRVVELDPAGDKKEVQD